MDATTLHPGDHVYRNVLVGQDRSFDITEPQALTVVRVNRRTVTVDTRAGSRLRVDPEDILGCVSDEDWMDW